MHVGKLLDILVNNICKFGIDIHVRGTIYLVQKFNLSLKNSAIHFLQALLLTTVRILMALKINHFFQCETAYINGSRKRGI